MLGSFSKGALEHQFSKGLRKLDVTVHEFDIQKSVHLARVQSNCSKIFFRLYPHYFLKPINREVIQVAKTLRPDCILVFKGMELLPETIDTLKAFTKILCNYNPDHPYAYSSRGAGNKNVTASIPYFDLHFSYSSRIVSGLQEQYKVQARQIPFGYDADQKPSGKKMGLSQDIIFVGAWDKERAHLLNQFEKHTLKIFGPQEWNTKTKNTPNCKSNFMDHPLYDQDYVDATHEARACINLLRPQNKIEDSHNMRTFEVPGYGGLLLGERTKEQLEYFEDKKEALFFSSDEELKTILQLIKKNAEAISAIKKNARLRAIDSNYDYYHRSKKMLDAICAII